MNRLKHKFETMNFIHKDHEFIIHEDFNCNRFDLLCIKCKIKVYGDININRWVIIDNFTNECTTAKYCLGDLHLNCNETIIKNIIE